MASLLNLPEEILIIIIKKLDLKSVYNLYSTCVQLKNIVLMYGVVKVCNMSMNTMASAQSLKLNFFKDISVHIKELNMSGVPNLNKTSLLPAVKMLKNLKSLNVSYTNINILDLIEVQKFCPTIKTVSINFAFGKSIRMTIPQKVIMRCQELFKNFENIYFVGSLNNLIYSKLALCILQKAKLNTLHFIVAECEINVYRNEKCNQLVQFRHFSIYLLNWWETNAYYGNLNQMSVLTLIEFKKYEFIIVVTVNLNRCIVYISPMFKRFFKNNFILEVECITELNKSLNGNVAIMIWNKELIEFNDSFYSKLKKTIKPLFPYYFTARSNLPVHAWYDWFHTMPIPDDIDRDGEPICHHDFKRRRIAHPGYILNYDAVFREKDKLMLTLNFNSHLRNPITLSSSSAYLRKLTYLSLCGCVQYSGEFFNVLFRCCEMLITLNVETTAVASCAGRIAQYVPLSSTLRNIRMIDKRIDFQRLFLAFSQCVQLENLHVFDTASDKNNDLSDPTLMFQNCVNLYCLSIFAIMNDSSKTKNMQMLNRAKNKCQRHYLSIELNTKLSETKFSYTPCLSVFYVSPIKPIEILL